MTIELKDKLYTSTEVANILGVSLRSVYRYLDEGKLDADVKTATGRHRFSKQNILDFLYPQGSNNTKDTEKTSASSLSSEKASKKSTKKAQAVEEVLVDEEELLDAEEELDDIQDDLLTDNTTDDIEENTISSDTETEEESSVDWLAKFRAAAEKYREEQATKGVDTSPNLATAVPIEPAEEVTTSVTDNEHSIAQEYEEEPEDKTEYYYLSGVGGLKEIAQSLDKAAKKASLDYAFTLDAGLSLFKPIRPFSVIHAYVKSSDRDYFEKALKLTEVSMSSAQLCLYISDEKDIYKNKREMYGLNVVSRDKLRNDLIAAGEKDLVAELETVA